MRRKDPFETGTALVAFSSGPSPGFLPLPLHTEFHKCAHTPFRKMLETDNELHEVKGKQEARWEGRTSLLVGAPGTALP